MGFFDWVSGIGQKIKGGIQKVGEFISDKVKPIVGTIGNIGSKVGEFIRGPIGSTILDGISMLPIPGAGTVAGAIRTAGRVAGTVGNIANTVDKGLGIATGIASNLSGDNPNIGQAVNDVRQGIALGGDVRNQYNEYRRGAPAAPPRPAVYRPSPYRR